MEREKKVRRPSVRTTEKAAVVINNLAKQLFSLYKTQLQEIGITRPSAKVAVDYLVFCAYANGPLEIGKITKQNNLYMKLGRRQ